MAAELRGLILAAALFVAAGLGVAACGSGGQATNYPERDIVTIVPFKPGGGTDVISRAAAPYMKKYLPKPVNLVVQNVDAAGGRVGSFQVYDAKPDGYTIGLLEPGIYASAEVLGEAGSRKISEITWLPRVSNVPYILATSPQSPIQTIQDLKGKRVKAAVSASTLPASLAVLKLLGADPQPVLYAGGADSTLATMRGDTDIVLQVAGTVLRQAESSGGKLIPMTVMGDSRFPDAPDLKASKELGVTLPPELVLLLNYDYVWGAPKGLPPDVFKGLNEALEKTIADPAFQEELKKAKQPIAFVPAKEMQERLAKLPGVLAPYKEMIQQATK